MRLAIVTQVLTPYRIPLFEELHRLAGEFRVFVMAGRHSGRSWTIGAHGFETEVLPGLHIPVPGHPMPGLSEPVHLNFGAGRALRRFRPDVVMTGGFSAAHFAAYRYCVRHGARHVSWGELTLSDGAQRSRIRRWLRRVMIGGSSGCVAASSVARAAYLHYGAAPERILLSLMPVNVEAFRRDAGDLPPTDTPQVLTVGRLLAGKGFYELLAAFQRVSREIPAATLTIAGDGPEKAALIGRARDLGLADRVTFAGFVPPAALARLYRQSRVFAFASLFDTYGAVIPEAMASGAVVVSSVHAAATHDLIVDGVSGFRIIPEDAGATAAKLLRALALTPKERERMTAAAWNAVQQVNVEAAAADTMRFLEALP